MKTTTFSIIALIILALVLIGIGPILTIMSLNALFALGIGITLGIGSMALDGTGQYLQGYI